MEARHVTDHPDVYIHDYVKEDIATLRRQRPENMPKSSLEDLEDTLEQPRTGIVTMVEQSGMHK